jgi:hypothetical protein
VSNKKYSHMHLISIYTDSFPLRLHDSKIQRIHPKANRIQGKALTFGWFQSLLILRRNKGGRDLGAGYCGG